MEPIVALRAAHEVKFDVNSEKKLPKSHMPVKPEDMHIEFNHGVGVDFLCQRTLTTSVCWFLSGFKICFPAPSERPDDVLLMLMVWMNWARHMNDLISDIDEFKGDLSEFVEARGIRLWAVLVILFRGHQISICIF